MYKISAGGALSAQQCLRSLGDHLRPVSLGKGLNVRSIGTPRHTKRFKSLPISFLYTGFQILMIKYQILDFDYFGKMDHKIQ